MYLLLLALKPTSGQDRVRVWDMRGVILMRRTWSLALGLFALGLVVGNVGFVFTAYAGGPPQPYYADYVMGKVDIPDGIGSEGLRVSACISGCHVYQTEDASIEENGDYKLSLHPADRRLAGRTAIIYLSNDYGSVRANDTVSFSGGFKTHQVDLTFEKGLPVSPDLPELPLVGDAVIPQLPLFAIVFGIASIILGIIIGKAKNIKILLNV